MRWFLLLCWLAAAMAACSGGGKTSTEVDAAVVDDDVGGQLDSASGPDSSVDASTTCPGGAGCACKEAADCNNGFCIETPAGQRCASTCVDSCPDASFKCASVPQGPDIVQLCIPRWGRLCEPCATDTACQEALGGLGGVCVNYGGQDGAFCGVSCGDDGDCPGGYACSEVVSTSGKPAKQCKRLPEAGLVMCPCSARAVAFTLSTSCSAAAVGTGTCPGTRQCGPTGLTACTAPQAAAEVCNGVDDDCNGKTDEGLCNDDNPCTDDACDVTATACTNVANTLACDDGNACTTGDTCAGSKCVGEKADCDDKNACTADTCDSKTGCENKVMDGASCEDGNACTLGDSCAGPSCQAGKGKDCTDGSDCTQDLCDTATGTCAHVELTGQPCSDGNACTKSDTCAGATCLGEKVDCDDKNACTADTCDSKTGCQNKVMDGASCEDGNACTLGDSCAGASCQAGKAKDCSDGSDCTQDLCDTVTGTCAHVALTGQPCTDGNACTAPDTCVGAACQGKVKVCDDGNPCTDDSCDPAVGCKNAPNTKGCDDQNACTTGDVCDGKGACFGQSIDPLALCNDNNPCTADQCDVAIGCKNPPQVAKCDDGNPCTNGDVCTAGKCTGGNNVCACQKDADCKDAEDGDVCNGTLICDQGAVPFVCKVDPKTIVKCDTSKDGTCLKSVCDGKTGQCSQLAEADGKPCDADGSVCTVADTCKTGACAAGDKLPCDDGNPCTNDSCDPKNGCQIANNVLPCSDGNACTQGDTCSGGGCAPGPKKVCDDDNTCTVDSCDTKTGNCLFNGVGQEGDPCDADQSVCTVGDKCGAGELVGQCVPGAAKNCNDQNPCTTDACEPLKGCGYTNNTEVCSDGNACTVGDGCQNGSCTPGKKTVCDDGSPCTADSCDTSSGKCVFNGAPFEGDPCDADQSVCTVGDKCVAGKCVAGGKKDCDDKNVCTTDACDAQKGCGYLNNSDACSDGNACTVDDGCQNGSCAPGKKTVCDDGSPCTADSCDPVSGKCVFNGAPFEGEACDADQSVCTVGDKCVAGKCAVGAKKDCDDKNVCTTDGCDAKTGCTYQSAAGSCDADGSVCTDKDVCQNGNCAAGPALNCDDANPCTADACDKVKGCTHAAVTNGLAPTGCDGGKHCVAGACVVKGCGDGFVDTLAGEQCDDANPTACDGCEACKYLGMLTLDGKGWASAAAKTVAPGPLQGQLGLEQDLTLEAWVRPTDFATDRPVVAKALATGAAAWRLSLQGSTGKPMFYHKYLQAEVVIGTVAVQANTWTHVAVVVAGAQVRFFVGGKPAGSVLLQQERRDVAAAVVVGADQVDGNGAATGNLFVGQIDGVHVAAAPLYGNAFTPSRRPWPVAATRALWLFDDLKGPTSVDASGIGNTLTLQGSAALVKDTCLGAPADAAVCGDGKVASAFETCDDANGAQCDGCERCQSRATFEVAAKGTLATPALGTWAADASCPTCTATVEAWVKLDSTSGKQFLFSSSCGSFVVYYATNAFYAVRSPEGPMTASNSPVAGTPGTVVAAGVWYHVAVTFGWSVGSEMRLYVNGKNEARRTSLANVPADASPEAAVVGAASGSTPPACTAADPLTPIMMLNGQIDEVRVSAGARYTDDFVPQRRLWPDAQTRGLWHFDDAPATTTDDSGKAVATKVSGVTAFGKDVCYGENPALAICGDGGAKPARWEMCDSGASNGDFPATCSTGCTSAFAADCTAFGWSAGQVPSWKGGMPAYTPQWTLEGWVRLPAFPASGYGVIAGVEQACPSMPGGASWAVAVAPNGIDASFLALGAASSSSKALYSWKLNTWQHFALQYHGASKGSLYVDGVLVRSFDKVPAAWDVSCPLKLGDAASAGNLQHYYLGAQLAGLRLSKRVRYGQPSSPPWTLTSDSATVSLFQMDTVGTAQIDAANVFQILGNGGTTLVGGPACAK